MQEDERCRRPRGLSLGVHELRTGAMLQGFALAKQRSKRIISTTHPPGWCVLPTTRL
jgi:hypothetical protein